ncbi:MAG: hypothetical protein WC874_03775 [Candidatus Izemoplasmatales bacterium]|jgi:hypothetical protein
MCDTLVTKTSLGMVFGKNSDRSPNEPNLTLFNPATEVASDPIQCTYREVPNGVKKNAVLMVAPSWMWGAEMGINDKGVMIGNEAVFTTSKGKKNERLTGMDMLRLALERTDDAYSAVMLLIDLLVQYGQGGNCGFDKPFYYDNSFLVSDRKQAFILETSGQEWVIKSVMVQGNISNRLQINRIFDQASSQENLAFAHKNSEPIYTFFSGSKIRQEDIASQLMQTNDIDVSQIMTILRSHNERDNQHLYEKGSVKSVCMHKSLLGDHTTGSMIVVTRNTSDTIWVTGCSTPCLSLYKPVYFGVIVPPVFTDKQASLNYWLTREYLVRAIYGGLVDENKYRHQIDMLQKKFIDGDCKLFTTNPSKVDLERFAKKCCQQEQELINQYKSKIEIVKNNPSVLPKKWAVITERLGKAVFEPTLEARIKA